MADYIFLFFFIFLGPPFGFQKQNGKWKLGNGIYRKKTSFQIIKAWLNVSPSHSPIKPLSYLEQTQCQLMNFYS